MTPFDLGSPWQHRQASTPVSAKRLNDREQAIVDQINAQSASLAKRLTGSATWDPASVAAGAQVTTTLSVPGAAVGDAVSLGFAQSLQGMQLTGYVSAVDTVTAVLQNGTGGALDLASGTLLAVVDKA